MATSCLISFKKETQSFSLPKEFAYPFFYTPLPIARLAAEEFQANYLKPETFLSTKNGIVGKMIGILVVQNPEGKLDYIAAYSGKKPQLATRIPFVPDIFDLDLESGHYSEVQEEIYQINVAIRVLKDDPVLTDLVATEIQQSKNNKQALAEFNQEIKKAKKLRALRRKKGEKELSNSDFQQVKELLAIESVAHKIKLKYFKIERANSLLDIQKEIACFQEKIEQLKNQRRQISKDLQTEIHQGYALLNAKGETKGLDELFFISPDNKPPSGAGDCAAPRLFQYAYQNKLKPIALAEFWWGPDSLSAIRKQGNYYTACIGKCEPILTHMLNGLNVEKNPLLQYQTEEGLTIVYEDDYLLLINKPSGLLSVPGKKIKDSVYTRIQQLRPQLTGPIIIHRLDMSTSGLLVLAKNKEIHKAIQKQFIERSLEKRYVALLEKKPKEKEGIIDLPLVVDFYDRPRHKVCSENGKKAITKYKLIESTDKTHRIHFYPVTGRTHQLRVHAAHPLGLNCAIVGDDLYGSPSDRLYLHAEYLAFTHPITNQLLETEVKPPF